MPPFTSLSRLLPRRFFPYFPPAPPSHWLSHSSPSIQLVPPSAALFLQASPSSSVAKNLLKARELPSLSYLGLDAGDSRSLLTDQAIGLVAAAQANFMRVIVESAGGAPMTPMAFGSDPRVGKELLCVVRALLKKIGRRILVGDRVLVGAVSWNDRRGVIVDLYRRTSKVIDPPIANVDHLLLLFSMEQPKPEPFTLTRFLVEAESTGIPFTLALNKAELVSNQQAENIKTWLEHQEVGLISKKTGSGKHTTHYVSLHPLSGGGFLADTPGFNQPALLKVTKRTLAETFPEIRKLLRASEPVKCSFGDCLHIGEPGCVVNSEWERYPYYFQLLDEIKVREEFQLRAIGTKREADVRYKVGEMGTKHAEPMLEPKKHRRVSRKQLNQSILDKNDDLYKLEGYLSDVRGCAR